MVLLLPRDVVVMRVARLTLLLIATCGSRRVAALTGHTMVGRWVEPLQIMQGEKMSVRIRFSACQPEVIVALTFLAFLILRIQSEYVVYSTDTRVVLSVDSIHFPVLKDSVLTFGFGSREVVISLYITVLKKKSSYCLGNTSKAFAAVPT
jgi:hypothetical protein